jgi:hypothetical protein
MQFTNTGVVLLLRVNFVVFKRIQEKNIYDQRRFQTLKKNNNNNNKFTILQPFPMTKQN